MLIPGHIPLLFGSFVELSKNQANIYLFIPFSCRNAFKFTRQIETHFKNSIFSYIHISKNISQILERQDIKQFKLILCLASKYAGSKTIVSSQRFPTKRNLRWWNLEHFGNMKIVKHKYILLNQTDS